MRKNREEIITYINSLKDYDGYVQFSHREIDLQKDIFPKKEDLDSDDTKNGFIYEAHFCKDDESIAIRQINGEWVVSIEKISNAHTEIFHGIEKLKVKMAQIWATKKDKLCEDFEVLQLQKVVFAGFEKGEK